MVDVEEKAAIPAIYSTADITGNDVTLVSGIAQVVAIEDGNSVTLDNADLTANHTSLNGNDSYYQAVLIYQSMSGGSITNANGDIFHVTSLTNNGTINTGSYTLYVNGTAYTE